MSWSRLGPINGTDRQAPAMRRALGRSGLGVGVRCCPPIAAVVCFARLCQECLSLHWRRGCCTLVVSVRLLLVQTCYLYAISILWTNLVYQLLTLTTFIAPQSTNNMQVLFISRLYMYWLESLPYHRCNPGIFFCKVLSRLWLVVLLFCYRHGEVCTASVILLDTFFPTGF